MVLDRRRRRWASFTTAAGGASNFAIQLAATTGVARTAASVAALEAATTLCLRARVKGSALIPGASANRALADLSDGSGGGTTGAKAIWELRQDGAGAVQAYSVVAGVLNGLASYAASAITDPTAWYQVLWTWNPASATQKRAFFVWKEGTTAPVVNYTLDFATTTNFTTVAGQAILSIGRTLSNDVGSNQTDWDFVALYTGGAYDGYDPATGAPAVPTGADSGVLACYLFPEGSGSTTANAVSGGPALALTNATWEAGY